MGLAIMYAVIFHFSVASICDQFGGQAVYRMCVPPALSTGAFYSILAILPALFLPLSPRVSSLMMFFVYVMHVFPSIAVYPYFSVNERLGGWLPIFVSATFSLLGWMFMSKKTIRLPKLNITRYELLVAFGIIYAISFGILYYSFDLSFNFVSIFDVYDVRSEFKNQLQDANNPIAGYVVTAAAYALAPAMIIFSKVLMKDAKMIGYIYLGLGVLLSLSVYALAAFKSGIFILLFTVMIVYFSGAANRRYIFYAIVGFAVFALAILLIGALDESNPVFAHWYRRAFVLPGFNTNLFYNHIGNSIFNGQYGMPSLVSRLYYGTDGSANSGVYGDGLARAGFVGAIFTVGLFGIMLKLMDSVTENMPPNLSTAFFLPVAYALSNSSTTSVMLTYGGAATLLFSYMLNEYMKRSQIGASVKKRGLPL